MQDLTLVGVHEDGEHVLLVGGDGQRYRLRVDEALRAAVRRDRPRLGQLQIEMDGRLRPRDIQARIRAGRTAEEVAEAAGLPVEHVRRYEGPVLAERAHVATQARKVVLRRAAPDAPTLEDFVAARLALREVDPEAALWDAWRTDEGLWTVQVTFTAGTRERHARWTYDPRVRHVTALDDEARWLSEPDRDGDVLPGQRLSPVRGERSAGRGGVAGVADELPVDGQDLADDRADDPAQDAADEVAEDPVATTVDLLDTLRARRGRRGRPVAPDDDADADPLEDLLGTLLSRADAQDGPARPEPLHDPGPNHPARRANGRADRGRPGVIDLTADTAQAPQADGTGRARPAASGATAVPREGAAEAGRTGTEAAAPAERDRRREQPEEPADRPAAGRKSRRASVPSWDDIMFGARRE